MALPALTAQGFPRQESEALKKSEPQELALSVFPRPSRVQKGKKMRLEDLFARFAIGRPPGPQDTRGGTTARQMANAPGIY